MRVLVGSTGFVGSTLTLQGRFDHSVHRPDVESLRGLAVDEVVCAGLPAAKYLANRHPDEDWQNVQRLAGILATMRVRRFVLISTVDVYQPPMEVDETDAPGYAAPQAYGRHRAWFEAFVRAHFADHVVLRLPGLYGPGLRKNLIFDLLTGREEQWSSVAASSTFQFFDVTQTWGVVEKARRAGLRVLNVATEPVLAQEIAEVFGVRLGDDVQTLHYDVRTAHAQALGSTGRYLHAKDVQLQGIARLRDGWGEAVAR